MPEMISLIGSTGSIGTQSLDLLRQFPEQFQVYGLGAGKNIQLLAKQIAEFKPSVVSIQDDCLREDLLGLLKQHQVDPLPEILSGAEGLIALSTGPVSTVVVGVVGLIGLAPTLAALENGKRVLTANKETFVAGGHLVSPYLSQILPIDSEHSAIHQCIAASKPNSLSKLILTASGGPFRTWSTEQIKQASLEQALKHPNWVMGKKITIDSATLMNKGLEVIEAHWLFGMPYDAIEVLIHPQSTVHSGVEFVDGAILFQLGATDMRGPIQYALFHPERVQTPFNSCRMDLSTLKTLEFEPPDFDRFPCLRLAYEAGRLGGSATTVLNAADEVVVDHLLKKEISLAQIPRLIEQVLSTHHAAGITALPSLEEIHSLDQWTRQEVTRMLPGLKPTLLV